MCFDWRPIVFLRVFLGFFPNGSGFHKDDKCEDVANVWAGMAQRVREFTRGETPVMIAIQHQTLNPTPLYSTVECCSGLANGVSHTVTDH